MLLCLPITTFVPFKKGLNSSSSAALQLSAKKIIWRQRKAVTLAKADHMLASPSGPGLPPLLARWSPEQSRSLTHVTGQGFSHRLSPGQTFKDLPPAISTHVGFTPWKSLPLPKAV